MPEEKTERTLLNKTVSLCPECLKILPAEVFEEDSQVFIEKSCSKHGLFREVYWEDAKMFKKAKRFAADGKGVQNPAIEKQTPLCPFDCGLCQTHKSHTALANIVLTNRCDLNCWYCFFFSEKAGYVYEPTLAQIKEMAQALRNEKPIPCQAVQLTGGEPTLRKDLIEIIELLKKEGFSHVQLNTDGINLALKPELATQIKKAGVNTLYLSFDGVTPQTNPKNHFEIPRILENCRKARLGTVLVPTLIKGQNDHEIKAMIDFGLKNSDVIRAVNFQPVSLVGRMPQKEREKCRITIPGAIKRIEEQTNGIISREDFFPVPTVMPLSRLLEVWTGNSYYELSTHFACGMATYVFNDKGKPVPISRFLDVEGFVEFLNQAANEIQSGKSKYLVGTELLWKLKRFVDFKKLPSDLDFTKILYNVLIKRNYRALGKLHHKALFIGFMHFMDLYNYDLERVKRCCIHYAVPGGKIIPFCTFNVIPEKYRDKIQRKYGMPISEWEKSTGRKLKDDYYIRKLP